MSLISDSQYDPLIGFGQEKSCGGVRARAPFIISYQHVRARDFGILNIVRAISGFYINLNIYFDSCRNTERSKDSHFTASFPSLVLGY